MTNQTFTGPRISYIREYDSRGSIIWTSEFSNSTNILSSVLGIYASASRVFILTGLSLFAYNLDGSQLWSYSFGAPGFISPFSVLGDVTGVYVSGTVKSSILSFPTGFLTMFDSKGNILWNAAFDSPDKGGLGITSVSADPSGIYVSMVSGSGNDFVKKYDSEGNQVWSFQTPIMPARDNFLVAVGSGMFYLAGATLSSQGWMALVQGFSESGSLIFFGINPPFSFVTLGTLIAISLSSIIFLRRRYTRMMSRHPKSTSNDRHFKQGGPPAD